MASEAPSQLLEETFPFTSRELSPTALLKFKASLFLFPLPEPSSSNYPAGACWTAGPGGRSCWLPAALGFTCPMNSDGKSTWKLPLPPSPALPSSDLCEEHATAQGGFEVSRISTKHCTQVCYLSHNPKKKKQRLGVPSCFNRQTLQRYVMPLFLFQL